MQRGAGRSTGLLLPSAWRAHVRIPMKLLRDCRGASAAEYALILAIVGAGIALAAYTLGKNISNAMGAVGTKIGTCTAATPSSAPSGC